MKELASGSTSLAKDFESKVGTMAGSLTNASVDMQSTTQLVEQTAKATEEIGRQITQIQASTKDAVGAFDRIGSTLSRINEIAATIAAAVEQQSAATGDIARTVHQAAAGTKEVTRNISAANRLSSQANDLSAEVDKFIAAVKAA